MELTLLLEGIPCPECTRRDRLELVVVNDIELACGHCKNSYSLKEIFTRLHALRDLLTELTPLLSARAKTDDDSDTITRRDAHETGK